VRLGSLRACAIEMTNMAETLSFLAHIHRRS